MKDFYVVRAFFARISVKNGMELEPGSSRPSLMRHSDASPLLRRKTITRYAPFIEAEEERFSTEKWLVPQGKRGVFFQSGLRGTGSRRNEIIFTSRSTVRTYVMYGGEE
jgi:hypothetical protein